jgi:hypothetical protein
VVSDSSAARLEAHADEIMARALAIIRTGDDADAWRVIEGLMNRAYGRSKETVEHQTSELDRLLALPVEERERLRAELAERRARLEAVSDPACDARLRHGPRLG